MTFDDFKKTELRVGKVISAEKVEGSEKLLKLMVDLGEGSPRQIVSGIAAVYAPEAMVGREVVIVANLDPRKLMGLESNGMLLAAHDENGAPALLTVEREVPPGVSVT